LKHIFDEFENQSYDYQNVQIRDKNNDYPVGHYYKY